MKSFCIFGDSLARGVVLDPQRQRYVFSKESFVELFCGQTGLSGKNLGKFGATVETGLEAARQRLGDIQAADMTILEYGGNDADFNWDAVSREPEAAHLPRTPLDVFLKTYACLIQLVREQGGRPVLMNLPPIYARQYVAWISRERDGQAILRWLGTAEYMYRFHEMYSVAVDRLANEWNVPLIDVRTAFLRQRDLGDVFCQDGIHPNEAGHQLIAQAMVQALPRL